MSTEEIRERLLQRLRERVRALSPKRWGVEAIPPLASPPRLLSRGQEWPTPYGCCSLIRFPISSLGLEVRPLAERLQGSLPLPFPLHRWLWLDIETLGLSGASHPLFLVGLARWRGEELEIWQFFARHLGEEKAVVAAAKERIEEHEGLVTFNGSSFDWPYLCHRWRHHGLPSPALRHHVDVLLMARQRIGYRYGNCRLQTLEARLCGRRRREDIPSHQIPEAYRRYLQSRQTEEIERVLHHNALDLLTTVELLLYLR